MKNSSNICPKTCPTESFFKLVSGPWTILILWKLSHYQSMRFGELKRAIDGISARILTERLRKLEEAGFVTRDYKPTVPPEVSYALSEKGCELRQTLGALDKLARKWNLEDTGSKTGIK